MRTADAERPPDSEAVEIMARGWESKNVESQQDDRERADKRRQAPMTAEERERAQKRTALEVSRKRAAGELASTTSEARRRSLESAIAHLDAELEKLG